MLLAKANDQASIESRALWLDREATLKIEVLRAIHSRFGRLVSMASLVGASGRVRSESTPPFAFNVHSSNYERTRIHWVTFLDWMQGSTLNQIDDLLSFLQRDSLMHVLCKAELPFSTWCETLPPDQILSADRRLFQFETRLLSTLFRMSDYCRDESAPWLRNPCSERWYSVIRLLERFDGDQVCLSTVAEQLHVSPETFRHFFTNRFGYSFSRFVRYSRIKKVASLLRVCSHSAREAGEAVGYSIQSNFSRDFRLVVGILPSKYREQWMQIEMSF